MLLSRIHQISDYRTAIMGIAILWIYLFHAGNCGIPILDAIMSKGWYGVDIFFFISGLGLSFSLSKCNSIKKYFKRRFTRVIPTWEIVLLLVNLAGISLTIIGFKDADLFTYPRSIYQYICWYTGIGYWINGIVPNNPADYYYEWYIPTLLLYYILAPLIFKLPVKILMIVFLMTIPATIAMYHWHILPWLILSSPIRFGAFLLGFITFYTITKANELPPLNLYNIFFAGLTLVGILCISILGFKPMIPFIPVLFMGPFLILISSVLRWLKSKIAWMISIISLIGSISLEIYLVHLYNRPIILISHLLGIERNSLSCIFIAFCLVIVASLALKKITDLVIKLSQPTKIAS